MVLASICERVSTAFYFASTSCDHICLVSSEHFRNSNPFSISHVVLVTTWGGCPPPHPGVIHRSRKELGVWKIKPRCFDNSAWMTTCVVSLFFTMDFQLLTDIIVDFELVLMHLSTWNRRMRDYMVLSCAFCTILKEPLCRE